jgi:hypothetical protein
MGSYESSRRPRRGWHACRSAVSGSKACYAPSSRTDPPLDLRLPASSSRHGRSTPSFDYYPRQPICRAAPPARGPSRGPISVRTSGTRSLRPGETPSTGRVRSPRAASRCRPCRSSSRRSAARRGLAFSSGRPRARALRATLHRKREAAVGYGRLGTRSGGSAGGSSSSARGAGPSSPLLGRAARYRCAV